MLKGLAITPPVAGRITIGRVVEKNGKRLPEKDDQFTITTQIQHRLEWLLHPLNLTLRGSNQEEKLRRIPIRLMFNDPSLNFRADYSLFDRSSGRPMCVGDGDTCKRMTNEGLQTLPCPGADLCPLGQHGGCKPYGRLTVQIDDGENTDSFIFRTTGFNSIRTLFARLHYFSALSNNKLACLPLELRLRGKSTRMSHGTAIFYADITLRSDMSMEEALIAANALHEQRVAAGFNQEALDAAAHQGLNNGTFEDDEDDVASLVEEFYPAQSVVSENTAKDTGERLIQTTNNLAAKLEHKVRSQADQRHLPVQQSNPANGEVQP